MSDADCTPGREPRSVAASFTQKQFNGREHKTTDHSCCWWPINWHHHHDNRFMALFPRSPGWAGARRELLHFMVQGKINSGRHTDHPAGRHSIRTSQCPPPPSPHIMYRPDALPAAQPTASKHWNQLKPAWELSADTIFLFTEVWAASLLSCCWCLLLLAACPYLLRLSSTTGPVAFRRTFLNLFLRVTLQESCTKQACQKYFEDAYSITA